MKGQTVIKTLPNAPTVKFDRRRGPGPLLVHRADIASLLSALIRSAPTQDHIDAYITVATGFDLEVR